MGTSKSLADVVSANVRAFRERRGMTVRELSSRLGELGHKLVPSGVTKIEHVDATARRRVDVDDLAALALALDTSPAYLMTPTDAEPVAVTPTRVAGPYWVGEWCRGEAALPRDGQNAEEADVAERRLLEFAPEYLQRQRQAGLHPAMLALLSLETFVRDAVLDDRASMPKPKLLAEGIRREAERVTRYADLLADEVERRGEDRG